MRFGVLGPLEVLTVDGTPVTIPERKVRTLLAALLVSPGRPVAAHRLIDDLWGDLPPGRPDRALQAKVSQLRRALEEAEPGGRELVVTRAPGYALDAGADGVDTGRFAALVVRARAAEDPGARAALLTEALGVWRGPAFAGFEDDPFARAAIDRWEEERLTVLEDRAEAHLDLGEHRAVIGELADLAVAHPSRERLHALQMRALYRAGRQSEALAGYEELRTRLADELGLDPGPEVKALYQAILRQDPSLAPVPAPAAGPARPGGAASARPNVPAPLAAPVPTSPPVPVSVPVPVPAEAVLGTDLPVPLTALVGRDDAVAEIGALVASRRLVTLGGPGGVGKTRLAVEVAGRLRDSFPDGVRLVELANATGGLAAAEVALAALGIRDDGAWGVLPPQQRPAPAERLAAALRDKRMLLLLDNCEHIVDEAATLTELLLRSAPGLRVLATSQEALALAGETLWSVPVLAPAPAVELFAARAAAAAPGFTLDDTNHAVVQAICRRLDGIPLALELAATRIRALGADRLLAALDDRFRLLGTGRRGAPARQQTLRAVIDWSWDLLTDAERTVLRRLAVHADGCTPEAAQEVCAAGDPGDVAPEDVLDLLIRLVDRSLVTVTHTAPDGPRYRLLESVAAYCTDRMRETGELTAVRRRHLAHYTALAEQAAPRLRSGDQERWLRRLDTEAANLRAALDTALCDGAPPPALRLADALAWYWVLRGRLGEGLRHLTAALALPGEAPRALRARVTVWRTGFTILTGDGTDRMPAIRRALTPYTDPSTDPSTGSGAPLDHALNGALADPYERAHAQWFLSHALSGTGSMGEGEELTAAALDGFTALADPWGTAAALSDSAVQRLLRGDLDGAARDGGRGADLFGRIGDAVGGLWTVYPLAALAEIHGDYARAAHLQREGLRTAQRLGLTTQAADLLSGLGRIALLSGDAAAARTHHENALRLATERGFRAGAVNAELGLGLGARREGRLDEAETRMRTVLEWHQEVGLAGANALILAELGFIAELRGDACQALRLQHEGFRTARTTGDPRALALALEGLAGAHTLAGHPAAGALLLGAATASRAAIGAPLPEAERSDTDRVSAEARRALGESVFAAHFARGRTLTPEAAYAGLPPDTGLYGEWCGSSAASDSCRLT